MTDASTSAFQSRTNRTQRAISVDNFLRKSLRVSDPQVKRRTLIPPVVVKIDAQTMHTRRHHKWNLEVRLVLVALHLAGQH